MKYDELINDVKEWFSREGLTHAVVGFSGGIDSATTAGLLAHAGIPTTIVLAVVDDQKRSSEYPAQKFADLYPGMKVKRIFFNLDMLNTDAAKEAALPIMRNAFFYGICAELRTEGKKPIVVGTANFDEAAYLGFWGKASDGAQDFYPISHLHKSQVRELAKFLKVPKEIIDAVPSGDLMYSGDLNDYKMIGATYDQVEEVAKLSDQTSSIGLRQHIEQHVDDKVKFADNIVRNYHKYSLPFPGVHLSHRLEHFRNYNYPSIYSAAKAIEAKYA